MRVCGESGLKTSPNWQLSQATESQVGFRSLGPTGALVAVRETQFGRSSLPMIAHRLMGSRLGVHFYTKVPPATSFQGKIPLITLLVRDNRQTPM